VLFAAATAGLFTAGSLTAAAADAPAKGTAPVDTAAKQPAKKLNVLLLMADDLRVELGCYGSKALTPNIDRLAERGIRFERVYCQQSLCNPSRSSMLTGFRPDTLHHWSNSPHFRDKNPDVVTLPQLFLQNGYVTRDVGKIFHNWHTKEKGDRRSWSAPEFLHYAQHADDKPKVDGEPPVDASITPKCERRDVPDSAYFDGQVADEAVRVLDEIKDKPFFLAVGFWKPHAPFNAPLRYWEKYLRNQLPEVDLRRPAGAPEIAFHDGRELRGIPPKQVDFTSDEIAEIRHGYFAGIAYMDAQLGRVVDALESAGLRDSTVIVFCSDHGYHLGEHGLWAKTSNFELDARVPLIICPPESKQAGSKSSALVELLDLYPTLASMCRLKAPANLEGQDLAPVLDDPKVSVKRGAFTQHPRPAYFDRTDKGVPDAMGYSIRTANVRYTEWRDWETGKLVGRELYDHRTDPTEMSNTVENPADAKALSEAVSLLHAQFPTDTPPAKR
jgi:iduronate 2-sulfatase